MPDEPRPEYHQRQHSRGHRYRDPRLPQQSPGLLQVQETGYTRGRLDLQQHPLERLPNLAHGARPPRRRLRQHPGDQVHEPLRDPRNTLRQRHRLLAQDRRRRFHPFLSLERMRPRDHLVQHRAEREDVRAVIQGLTLQLLRRHVRQRAQRRPRLRQLRDRLDLPRRGLVGHQPPPRQAEVRHLRMPRPRQHHVGRLEVPMHEMVRMCRLQRVRNLRGQPQRLPQRQRAERQARLEAGPVDVLHHDERRASGFAGFVHHADMGMSERGGRSRLPQKTPTGERVPPHILRQELDGDVALQHRVPCQEHFTHPALADPAQNPVVRQAFTDFRHGRLPVDLTPTTRRPPCAASAAASLLLHWPKVLVEPVQGFLHELIPGRDVIGVVRDQPLVLSRGP